MISQDSEYKDESRRLMAMFLEEDDGVDILEFVEKNGSPEYVKHFKERRAMSEELAANGIIAG